MNLYTHLLTNAPHYREHYTRDVKVGGAFENGRAFSVSERRNTLSWGPALLAAGLCLCALALGVL